MKDKRALRGASSPSLGPLRGLDGNSGRATSSGPDRQHASAPRFTVRLRHLRLGWILAATIVLGTLLASREWPRKCRSLRDVSRGRWLRRRPVSDGLEQWVRSSDVNATSLECFAPPPVQYTRTLAVANWQWEPQSCQMRPWDAEAFVQSLLLMPYGIIFVGDSLAKQQFDSMCILLGQQRDRQPGLVVDKVDDQARVPGATTRFLNPQHPLYHKLLEEGSVSLERLRRPIAVRFVAYHLLANTALAPLIPRDDEAVPVQQSEARYHDAKTEDWLDFVASVSTLYENDAASVRAFHKTVIVVSSGPHWTARHLVGLPTVNTSEAITIGYERTVRASKGSRKGTLLKRTRSVISSTDWSDCPGQETASV